MDTKILLLTLFFSSYFAPTVFCISAHIPNHILQCYRRNMTEIQNQLKLPMTIQVFIELLQKIEMYGDHFMDMRLTATSMLFRLKFDGIQRAFERPETEHLVPVGPTALHFNKFKLLLNYLLSGNDDTFPGEALSTSEFCALHFMVSSSVQAWQRGDESRTCPQIQMLPNNNSPKKLIKGKQKSSCPIEEGVLKTNWGDIAIGHLLTAITAALQRQDVKLIQIAKALARLEHQDTLLEALKQNNTTTNNINNLWAATLAGDLAEVVMFQGPFANKWSMGAIGTWNDSHISHIYYLPDEIGSSWEMTLAETLGGIDGVIIGNTIHKWLKEHGRLRLSQVLDMYYSRRGITFDEYNYKACQRKDKIKEIINDIDLAAQTEVMTIALQYHYSPNPSEQWVYLPQEQIETFSTSVVDSFSQDLDALVDRFSACEKGYSTAPTDIFTIIDNAWSEYEGRRLIAALAQATDVSLYGSKLGIINGNTGAAMTNLTYSIFQIFEELSRPDVSWPTSMTLSNSLETIVEYLNEKTNRECTNKFRSTRNLVILVLAHSGMISSTDLEKSQSLITSIKSINPSTIILYITEPNSDSFDQLAKNEYMNDDTIKTEMSIDAIVHSVSEKLKTVPGQIIELHCDTETLEYEDYITPNIPKLYEIPYKYLQLTRDIKVQFKGWDYGELSICANDKDNPINIICKGIPEDGNIEFETKPLCEQYPCNIQFQITLTNSKNKCSENECRYPDQGRIVIHTSWKSASASVTANIVFMLLILCHVVY